MASPHPTLLAVARGESGIEISDRDGDEFLRSAIEHRMTGLVQSGVTNGEVVLPAATARHLGALDAATWARHMTLSDGLRCLAARLDTAGIRWVTLKGVGREARWYARPGERPSWDLDVAIAPSQISALSDIIRLIDPTTPHADGWGRLVTHGDVQAVSLNLDGTGVPVDLHADPLSAGVAVPNQEWLWNDIQLVDVSEAAAVPVFGAEAELIHALVNLTRDRFRHLLGYLDVERISRDVDPARTRELAHAMGVEPVCHMAWEAASSVAELDSNPFPPVGGLRRRLWEWTWGPETRLRGEESRLRHHQRTRTMLPLMIQGSLYPWLRWMVRRPFPPREVVRLRHGTGPYLVALGRGRWRYWSDRLEQRRALD